MTAFNMLTAPRHSTAMDLSGLRRVAPSVFSETAMPGTSDRYAFISTATVVDQMMSAGFVPVRAAEAMVRRDGGEGYAKHMVIFRHRDHLNHDRTIGRDLTATRGHAWLEGGDVIPEIAMLNSHDGTGSFVLNGGLMRLACLNGLIVSDATFASLRVRHVGAATAGKVVDAAYEVVQDMPRVLDGVRNWQGLMLPKPAQQAFATAALDVRWDRDEQGNSKAPINADRLLQARRYGDGGKSDLWSTFNVIQENVMRGGVPGRGATGRRATTRAVNAPAENVRVNKALWELASVVARVMKEGDKALESMRVAA